MISSATTTAVSSSRIAVRKNVAACPPYVTEAAVADAEQTSSCSLARERGDLRCRGRADRSEDRVRPVGDEVLDGRLDGLVDGLVGDHGRDAAVRGPRRPRDVLQGQGEAGCLAAGQLGEQVVAAGASTPSVKVRRAAPRRPCRHRSGVVSARSWWRRSSPPNRRRRRAAGGEQTPSRRRAQRDVRTRAIMVRVILRRRPMRRRRDPHRVAAPIVSSSSSDRAPCESRASSSSERTMPLGATAAARPPSGGDRSRAVARRRPRARRRLAQRSRRGSDSAPP